MAVAFAPLSSTKERPAVHAGEILDYTVGFRVPNQRSGGNFKNDGLSVLPVQLFLPAGQAVLSVKRVPQRKMRESFEVISYLEDNIPATSAISPVGAPFGDILLPAKRNGAFPAVSR